jgi:hypothetical protein
VTDIKEEITMMHERMSGWRGLVRVGALLALGACSTQEYTVRNPDGTVITYRNTEFTPHFEVRPDQFVVRPAGRTEDGFPVEEIVRRDGKGTRFYRVTPPFGKPLFFRELPRGKPDGPGTSPIETLDEAPRPIAPESAPCDEIRVTAQMYPEHAMLEGRQMDGPWQTIVSGSFEEVARAAASRGMTPIEFQNEFGSWKISVDRRFPMTVVRLHGEIVAVRGLR